MDSGPEPNTKMLSSSEELRIVDFLSPKRMGIDEKRF